MLAMSNAQQCSSHCVLCLLNIRAAQASENIAVKRGFSDVTYRELNDYPDRSVLFGLLEEVFRNQRYRGAVDASHGEKYRGKKEKGS